MSDLQNGSQVRHATLGLGKIVALEPLAVHVFFPEGDKRFAAKLRLPAARALLRTDGFEPDGWLAGLTAFSLDAESGRYALSATFLTHEQALAQFRAALPGGFAPGDAKAKPGRVARWRAAHAAWVKLDREEAERLASEGEFGPIMSRIRDVEKQVAPLHPPGDVGAVEAALADEALARPFLVALTELLAAPAWGRARFEKLFSAARALPVEPAQQWLVATLFPFVAAPQRHVLLRPRASCLAADRLGSDLRYDSTLNWPTYNAMLGFSSKLLERLAPEGAVDHADVEIFLHVIAGGKRPARPAAPAKAAKGRPSVRGTT